MTTDPVTLPPCEDCGSTDWSDWTLLPHEEFNRVCPGGNGYLCLPCFARRLLHHEEMATMTQLARLNKGDRVLVVCDRDVTPEHISQVTEWLRGRFPDMEFTALGGDGIQSVMVQGADHEEGT